MRSPGPAGLPEHLVHAAAARTLVMGILNVTPDSFSDGGLYLDHDAAVEHGLELMRAGADLVDVGGESTRPGAASVGLAEESRRVVRVVADLAREGVDVSIDTRHAVVARDCVDAGAVLVNDVSAGRGDPDMWPYVAESGVPYVLMHNRGDGPSRDDLAHYDDVETQVWSELDARSDEAVAAGIAAARIVLDPGLGFAKRPGDNWRLVETIEAWPPASSARHGEGTGFMVGASRKRFLSMHPDGTAREGDSMALRDRLTVELTRRAARAGAWCVRVHDVAPNVVAVREEALA